MLNYVFRTTRALKQTRLSPRRFLPKLDSSLKTNRLNGKIRDLTKWTFDQVKNFLVLVGLYVIAVRADSDKLVAFTAALGALFCISITTSLIDFVTNYMEEKFKTKAKWIFGAFVIFPLLWLLQYTVGQAAANLVSVFANMQLALPGR